MTGTDPSVNWSENPSTGGGPAADTNVTAIGGTPISLGQKPMATSLPVAIASDQSAVPVTPPAVAHDAAAAAINPLLVGGYASAAAPANVSASGDAVRAWFLLNGALNVNSFGGVITPQFTATGDLETNTSAGDGTAWITFPSVACKQLTVVNGTGVAMRLRHSTGAGTGVGILLPDQTSIVRAGLTNANQISIRRNDLAATQVFIQAFWES